MSSLSLAFLVGVSVMCLSSLRSVERIHICTYTCNAHVSLALQLSSSLTVGPLASYQSYVSHSCIVCTCVVRDSTFWFFILFIFLDGKIYLWTNVKFVQSLNTRKQPQEVINDLNTVDLFPQTTILLIRKLCCMCLKTTKQWSRWFLWEEVRQWDMIPESTEFHLIDCSVWTEVLSKVSWDPRRCQVTLTAERWVSVTILWPYPRKICWVGNWCETLIDWVQDGSPWQTGTKTVSERFARTAENHCENKARNTRCWTVHSGQHHQMSQRERVWRTTWRAWTRDIG